MATDAPEALAKMKSLAAKAGGCHTLHDDPVWAEVEPK